MFEERIFATVLVLADSRAASEAQAVIARLHNTGTIASYDAATVARDESGRLHLDRHPLASDRGGWAGVGVGALLCILFPPELVVAPLNVQRSGRAGPGGDWGAVGRHLWSGLSRADLKELGEALDRSGVAVVVLGRSRLARFLREELGEELPLVEREVRANAGKLRWVVGRAVLSIQWAGLAS